MMIKLCLYANGRQLIKEKEEKSANHWALTYLLNLNSYTNINTKPLFWSICRSTYLFMSIFDYVKK